ncbi:hypothetical protein AB0H73_09695 [Streptomyces olivoreticuli]
MENTGTVPVPPLAVRVALPAGAGLWFTPGADGRYTLTVTGASGTEVSYPGALAPDGKSVAFTGVDPAVPGPGTASVMRVGVAATSDAPAGLTHLTFTVGGQTSPSTPVSVAPAPRFTITPGGPPTVALEQGGAVGYPGVRVEGTGAVAPLVVTVSLPEGRGLAFGTIKNPDHQLTVWNPATGAMTPYAGILSPDRHTLTFTGVDPGLPGASVIWACASATPGAPAGLTALAFRIGDQISGSTPVEVAPSTVPAPRYTVVPGGTTPLDLQQGGTPRYPGVHVWNTGTAPIPPQKVTVTLPVGSGLRFETEGHPTPRLHVWSPRSDRTVSYPGTLTAPPGKEALLTFETVDIDPDAAASALGYGAESVMWVAVSAHSAAPTGATALTFTVGDRTSPSTSLNIT